jgi:hypothetical protein
MPVAPKAQRPNAPGVASRALGAADWGLVCSWLPATQTLILRNGNDIP